MACDPHTLAGLAKCNCFDRVTMDKVVITLLCNKAQNVTPEYIDSFLINSEDDSYFILDDGGRIGIKT